MPNPSRRQPAGRVVVIGGGLAGMATSARLAKAGHRVILVEATDRLGGPWTSGPAPSVLAFPAPWRDLFRKSGRTLEEECRRSGLALVAAPPTRHRFDDGSVLELPSGRGDQYEAIQRFAGVRAAESWRELFGGLADLWQHQRQLGLEAELADGFVLDRRTRAALWANRSLSDLAAGLPDRRLASVVSDLGYLQGSTPEETPAFCATTLLVEQTFARWQLVRSPDTAATADPAGADPAGADPAGADPAGADTGRPTAAVPLSELADLLAARLELRRVEVRRQTRIGAIEADREGVRTVDLVGAAPGRIAADAVVACVHPERVYADWLSTGRSSRALRAERRTIRKTEPALAPHTETAGPENVGASPGAGETHSHRTGSAPVIEAWSSRPARFDYGRSSPDEAAGLRWHGFDSWLRRPPTRSALPGLFFAGVWCRSGQGPDREVLSAALAAAAAQDFLQRKPSRST